VLVDEAIVLECEALLLEDIADIRAKLRQREPADIVGRADDARLFEPATARVDFIAGLAVALLGAPGPAGAKRAAGDQREGCEAGELRPNIQQRKGAGGWAEAVLHG